MQTEKYSTGEIRGTSEQGIIDAYLTRWGTVDSYQSTFARGAFADSFRQRGPSGIRMLWNHETLAGKVMECREDDVGPYVRVQCNLETEAGKQAFSHVKNGDVRAFSFGFYAKKDKWEKGIRVIEEVDILECGPVVFEANPQASITAVRAQKYKETLKENDTRMRGMELLTALSETLNQIQWESEPAQWQSLSESAIAEFQKAYLTWITEWVSVFGESREIPYPNALAEALHVACEGEKLQQVASRTSFTLKELHTMARGIPISGMRKAHLSELGTAVQQAWEQERQKKVSALFDELRAGGFSEAEKARMAGLITADKDTGNTAIVPEILTALNALAGKLSRN